MYNRKITPKPTIMVNFRGAKQQKMSTNRENKTMANKLKMFNIHSTLQEGRCLKGQ